MSSEGVAMICCREIEDELPLYNDGVLEAKMQASIAEHLQKCPLCRQKLSEYRELSIGLRSLPIELLPPTLLRSIRSTMAARIAPSYGSPAFALLENRRDWLRTWLLPSSLGGIVTAILAFGMISFLALSPPDLMLQGRTADGGSAFNNIALQNRRDRIASEYAVERRGIASESPSINPDGSLIWLTRSLVDDDIEYDEVVVVADVFENGSARITEVVENPKNGPGVDAIEKALESELAYAPFVPAYIDNRPDTIRVVLRLQSVNVAIR